MSSSPPRMKPTKIIYIDAIRRRNGLNSFTFKLLHIMQNHSLIFLLFSYHQEWLIDFCTTHQKNALLLFYFLKNACGYEELCRGTSDDDDSLFATTTEERNRWSGRSRSQNLWRNRVVEFSLSHGAIAA